ncbi:hypothetical protein IscW_ISCW020201 [Ixodes scapularis]|uniref:Uncharacterized protein n=1 Tax=Ixodes scapularis TaxID=6945 RepID=B7Q0D9_IXOSC|nr:hypothetical protein IscW_ISCW020201 [Ixodes scapularis]|eukprot:XP_002407468.1 hypothetical protein IscW_ISCW020201 [Ixodes scapularis]
MAEHSVPCGNRRKTQRTRNHLMWHAMRLRQGTFGRLQQALECTKIHQEAAKKAQEVQCNKRRQALKVGDLVLRDIHTLSDTNEGISAKLAPRREGPSHGVHHVGENDLLLSDQLQDVAVERHTPTSFHSAMNYEQTHHQPLLSIRRGSVFREER